MEMKEKLIELLTWAMQEEEAFLLTLSPDQKETGGAPDRWATKDTFGHILVWNQRGIERVNQIVSGVEPPVYTDDIDKVNADIFEMNRHLPFTEMEASLRDSYQELIEHIKELSDDDLTDATRFAYSPGRALWTGILGNGVIHPVSHLAEVYLKQGKLEKAARLQEEAARRLMEMDDSTTWRGLSIYNLACFHAQAGQKKEALRELGEALGLRPDLSEWTRQDPDLISLHGDPAFEALLIKNPA